MRGLYFDEEEDAYATPESSPYPIYPAYRGQEFYHPWLQRTREVYTPEPELMGLAHDSPVLMPIQARELMYPSSVPQVHRIEGRTLDPGRTITNPAPVMAPCLISSIYRAGEWGLPDLVEDSAPDPTIQRSHGQWTAVPADMVHVTPKQLLDYDYQALSQSDIADRARLALRKAMYGQ